MGIVFQDFRLLPDKTVYENVAFAMYIVKATPRHIRRQVPMVLSLVGLSGKAKMYPNELSGGEQQRVALARALVNNPSMIIADEPTGNLDPDTAWEIMNLLNDINLRGTTIVVATHAKDIVDKMKKRVIQIDNGNIIRDDKKVKGVIGKPVISRSNRTNQIFFVNKRYVKDKTLSGAAEQAFKGFVTIGKHGFLVLDIEMDPQKVDVNVHPTKLEVRFQEETKIFKAIYHSIRDGLLKGDLVADTSSIDKIDSEN